MTTPSPATLNLLSAFSSHARRMLTEHAKLMTKDKKSSTQQPLDTQDGPMKLLNISKQSKVLSQCRQLSLLSGLPSTTLSWESSPMHSVSSQRSETRVLKPKQLLPLSKVKQSPLPIHLYNSEVLLTARTLHESGKMVTNIESRLKVKFSFLNTALEINKIVICLLYI